MVALRSKVCDPRTARAPLAKARYDNSASAGHSKNGDNVLLRRAVDEANHFMAGLRPSSIPAAMDANRRLLESLDPRLNVEITAKGSNINYEIRPKPSNSVQLTLEFLNDAASERMADALNKGLELILAPGEFKLTGSPLFERERDITLAVDLGASHDIDAIIWREHDGPRHPHTPITIAGKLVGGRQELRFTGSLSDSPLYAQFNASQFRWDESGTFKLHMGFRAEAWAGQKIRALAYYDQIAELFGGAGGVKLRIEFQYKGSRVFNGTKDLTSGPFLEGVRLMLEKLRMARTAATFLKINPVWPAEIVEEQIQDIERLYLILGLESDPTPAYAIAIAAEFSRPAVEKVLSEELSDLHLSFVGPLNFLGEIVDPGPAWATVKGARRITPADELRGRLADGGAVRLAWRSRRCPDVPSAWQGFRHQSGRTFERPRRLPRRCRRQSRIAWLRGACPTQA